MKPLSQLDNITRAKMLYELFPSEIPPFLEFMKAATENLLRDPDQIREKWNIPLFSVELWIRTATEINTAINKCGYKLSKSSRLFTDQLFDGYRALYSAHCLQQYVIHQTPENERFIQAVNLFF